MSRPAVKKAQPVELVPGVRVVYAARPDPRDTEALAEENQDL